jgi:glutamate-ammonia-ligase adenylyltransferase
MNTWLTSLTPAGMLYDTDLRLRPNGASGLLVSSVEAFAQYQHTQAWVWEHQALTRARYCAGDEEIGARFEQIRHEVLTLERDAAALKKEVLEMRQKMLDAHPNKSGQFDLKHDRGGIIDVEFAVQYLVLAHAHGHPELTRNIGNLALLKLAAELGLIPAGQAESTRDAYRHFRQWQHAMRLQSAEYARIDPEQAAPFVAGVQALWQTVFEGG